MARFSTAFVCFLAVTSFVMAEKLEDHAKELSIIKREALAAATIVRGIPLTAPHSKVQIATMASDYITFLNHAIYSLNNVVPNILTSTEHKAFAELIQGLSTFVHDIEQLIPGDAEQLKQKLAETVQTIHTGVSKFEQTYKDMTFTPFASNQYEAKNDFEIFGLYKLKTQAEFFEKTRKQLEAELDKTVVHFTEVINSVTPQDKHFEEELQEMLDMASVLIERSVYKLQNWVEVNPTKTAEIKTVEEATKDLSKMYETVNRAIIDDTTAAQLKTEVFHFYKEFQKVAKTLITIEYPDNTGGQEFIRSTVMSAVTFGKVYAENINIILNRA